MKRGLIIFVVAVLATVLFQGCSVYMAAKQPEKKNVDVLSVGTPRSLVLAEMGNPVSSESRDGKLVDIFNFVQGYSKAAKTGRALFHGVADVFTVGLWEVVATPTEAIFDGSKMSFEVKYDADDRVEKVTQLSGPSIGERPPVIRAQTPENEAAKTEKPQLPVAETVDQPRQE